ncbi:hypothetical protein EYF80_037993 [Liparis tanakae]|uniref:Uncharacterized protein n=1 Tax=Liparis tanakae TaxID=230148 RepID=A0A4Z2GF73_9TELE|nr:hypothetical protein EYF80_037993 [Liparis tanakae]
MTDPASQESYPVPDPTIVDPRPATARNGQCAPDGFTNNHHQQARSPSQPETFTTGHEMKITDGVEGEGVILVRGQPVYEHRKEAAGDRSASAGRFAHT